MDTGEITPQVIDFIHQYIQSVEQLEVLLFLLDNLNRDWGAAEISQRLYIHPDSAADRLVNLSKMGLAKQSASEKGELSYRFSPANESLRRAIAETAVAYRVRRASMITLIYEAPSDKLKSFADAFRIGAKKDDDKEK